MARCRPREVPEAFAGPERAAGQGPAPFERRRAPAPEQDVQLLVADLEDHGQRLVGEPRRLARGRLGTLAVACGALLMVACGSLPMVAFGFVSVVAFGSGSGTFAWY